MERIVYSDGNPPPKPGTGDRGLEFGESLTRQSEAKDADINVILERYVRTGVIPVDEREGMFMDVSEFPTYQEVRAQVDRATQYFLRLDASVRAKFENDPLRFLDALVDPANKQEFIDLGVLPKEEGPDGVSPKVEAPAAPVGPGKA